MSDTPTFTSLAYRWLEASAGNLAPRSVKHYRWLLENYVFPRFGEVVFEGSVKEAGTTDQTTPTSTPASPITEQEVREFLDEMKEKGFATNTAYMLPKLIFRILSFASAEGLCEAPQWNFSQAKPKRESQTVILTREQVVRLSTYLIENPQPRHLGMYLMLTAGLTVGEMRGLTWADVSFPRKRIRVLTERETTPDTRNKYRSVEMNEQQRIYLKRLASIPTVYVATGRPKPVAAYALRDRFMHVLQELGLKDMPLSDLRRTFAVRALENGMGFEELSRILGQKNSRNFRALFRNLVTPETRERLEKDLLASQKVRQAPATIRPPEKDPEVRELESKVESRRKQLKETLESLEGDLQIITALRKQASPVLGTPREGLYRFVEKVLGDDRDGKMLVEYLRCNMRISEMSSRKDVTVQTIRARVGRGFTKLTERLDAINAVEGYDILDMFHRLTARIQEVAPPEPKRTGPKPKMTLEKEFEKAMRSLDRMGATDRIKGVSELAANN